MAPNPLDDVKHDPSLTGQPRRRMTVVAVANQKGGVGKTTTSVNLSTLIAAAGFRVVLVDADPQGNATSSLGVDKEPLEATLYDVFLDGVLPASLPIASVRRDVHLIPATPDLAAAEVELVGRTRRERVLADVLAEADLDADVCLIDCPPSLGLLTVNALTAADHVLVPLQCEFLALEGLGQLTRTIELIRRGLNPDLSILGVLMTMYDARTRLSASVVEEVRRHFPHELFSTVIPRAIRLAEAPSYGQAIDEYDPESRGGTAYRALADEVIARLDLRRPAAVALEMLDPFVAAATYAQYAEEAP